MKTIILAAGQWKRLMPLTKEKAKPMIEVLSKPILEHILEMLAWLTSEVTIVVKYKKEQIIEYFWDKFMWIKITYKEQSEKKWTAWALMWIDINTDFILLNWDTIYNRDDLKNIYTLSWYWCLVKKVQDPSKYWVFKIKEGNLAEEVIEKPEEYVWNLANMWVYKFPSTIDSILNNIKMSPRWEYEITDAINEIVKSNDFKLVEQMWEFIDIWYPEDIEKAERILKNK